MSSIIVLGGGASGYAAAIRAADCGAKVMIVDAQDKPLRKVAASGNGRCNLSNSHISADCYCTQNPALLAGFLNQSALVTDFFRRLGVLTRADEEGRIYPYSNRARTVVDALTLRAERLGVKLVNERFLSCRRIANEWCVDTDAHSYRADAVVVALGSPASRSLGATETLADVVACHKQIGMVPFRPALVPLRTEPHYLSLKGSRQFVRLTLYRGKDVLRAEEGEVLYTEYGLSGVAVMQLSMVAGIGDDISVDSLPDTSLGEVRRMLRERARSGDYPTVDKLLIGLVDRPISYALLKVAGLSPLDMRITPKMDEAMDRLATALKDWRFGVSGDIGFDAAQVAAGGVRLDALDADLQSKSHPRLFFAGEGVDVTGFCGGYNLHWAWLSGLIAGERAAHTRSK